jgi:MFS family permease
MNKNILKSIGAVIAGFLVVAVLSVVTDKILESLGIFPSPDAGLFITWMLVLAFIYRSIFTVLGGYITARLSPQNPMKHVKILAIIGTIGGCIGIVVGWNLSDHWYPIALAVTAFPLVWLGGKLYTKK